MDNDRTLSQFRLNGWNLSTQNKVSDPNRQINNDTSLEAMNQLRNNTTLGQIAAQDMNQQRFRDDSINLQLNQLNNSKIFEKKQANNTVSIHNSLTFIRLVTHRKNSLRRRDSFHTILL